MKGREPCTRAAPVVPREWAHERSPCASLLDTAHSFTIDSPKAHMALLPLTSFYCGPKKCTINPLKKAVEESPVLETMSPTPFSPLLHSVLFLNSFLPVSLWPFYFSFFPSLSNFLPWMLYSRTSAQISPPMTTLLGYNFIDSN